MSLPARLTPRLRQLCRAQQAPAARRAFASSPRRAQEWPQRTPVGSFYKAIMEDPLPYPTGGKAEEPPNSAAEEVLPEGKDKVVEKAKEPPAAKPEAKKEEEEADKPVKRKPGRPRKNGDDANVSAGSTAPSLSAPAPSPATSPPTPSPPPTTAQDKARIVFGTRLAGPEDRDARGALRRDRSTLVAGVLVPPEPEEPDNCCMSGCVNCVWDLFREEMEEFTARRREAEGRLRARERDVAEASGSVEADSGGGGGDGVGRIGRDMWDEDVFKGLPVGIREFMKQEKRLKERHEREGTSGG